MPVEHSIYSLEEGSTTNFSEKVLRAINQPWEGPAVAVRLSKDYFLLCFSLY